MSGLTFDDAFDETSMVSTDEAIREIQNHGFDAYVTAKTLLAYGQGIMIPEIVAEVNEDNNVSSKRVLEWLGY